MSQQAQQPNSPFRVRGSQTWCYADPKPTVLRLNPGWEGSALPHRGRRKRASLHVPSRARVSPFASDSTVQMGLAELREYAMFQVLTGSAPLKSMVLGVISLKSGCQKRGQKQTL